MPLSNTLKAFEARLDEIATHQQFVSSSLKIGREASSYWDYKTLTQVNNIKSLVNEHQAGSKQVRLEDLCGALSVQLFAAVEWFIGQTLTKSVQRISNLVENFDDLPPEVNKNHIILTGRALTRIFESPPHERLDKDKLFRSLSGCVKGSKSFEINDDIFSFYLPNIDSTNLSKCLLRIGLKLDWDLIGENKNLQKLFQVTSKRKTANECSTFLDQCAKNRNAVAHRGDGSATTEFEELTKQIFFFRNLSKSLVEQVISHLNQI